MNEYDSRRLAARISGMEKLKRCDMTSLPGFVQVLGPILINEGIIYSPSLANGYCEHNTQAEGARSPGRFQAVVRGLPPNGRPVFTIG